MPIGVLSSYNIITVTFLGDDDGCQQWSYCRTAIATHLEDGLCQTLLTSRCHLCHSRSRGMKHRRTQTYDTYSQKNQKIILGESQQEQAHQCETHADGEGIGTGMLIGIKSCERLQDRRCHLENQRDDAYLCKREVELIRITCKSVWLRINSREPKKEELSVNNTSQLCSELLDFSVKRFCGSIC